MTRTYLAYLGLGANLGDAAATLQHATEALSHLPHTRLAAQSAFYATAPVDATGPDFINIVVALETELDAPALLAECQRIEQLHGRERPYRNAPRTLDIDILLHGATQLDTPTLTLPHPRMHQRAFVLAPLVEIAPTLTIPGHGRAADCLKQLGDQRISRMSD